MVANGNGCCARTSLLILLCIARSVFWCVPWQQTRRAKQEKRLLGAPPLSPSERVGTSSNMAHALSAVKLERNSAKQKELTGFDPKFRFTGVSTCFGSEDHHWRGRKCKVEQPGSSRLLDMPYIRHLLMAMEVRGSMGLFKRLILGSGIKFS